MSTLHPYWRRVFERAAKEANEVEIETICPMKPASLPYRERLCKIPKACVVGGRTMCRIAPAEVKS